MQGTWRKYDIEVNTQDPLGRLFHKYQFISPNVLMNSTTMLQLNTIITTCDELLINLECAKDKEAFNKAKEKLEHFVKAAIADIDFIKNTTRS